MPQSLLLTLGTLPRLKKPALLEWSSLRAIVLADSTRPGEATAALVETWTLELLGQLPQAQLQFHETAPSPAYRHLKRLLAHTGGAAGPAGRGEHLTQTRSVGQALSTLTELAHQRYSRMAAAGVDDWPAYLGHGNGGRVAANRPEPWHFLLLTDLQDLAASEPDALRALQRLCQQGPAAGIVPILIKRPLAHHSDQVPLHHKHIQAFWQDILPRAWGLDLTQAAEARLATIRPLNQHAELWRLLNRFGAVVDVPFLTGRSSSLADALIQANREQSEQASGDDFLHVVIGHSAQSGAPVSFRLGDASNCHHAFIGGETRSGKSSALMNVILGACEKAPPQALQLSLLDFKRNVSFGAFRGLPHVRTLIDHEAPESVLEALAEFEAEIDRRGALFGALPEFYNGTLAKYNARATSDNFEPLPRWLMILDEAHAPLQDNPRIRNATNRMLSRIARQGAGLGLHFIFSTQTLRDVALGADIQGQVKLRMVLKLGHEADARKFLDEYNTAPVRLVSTHNHKQAVLNTESGQVWANQVVDLAPLPDHELGQRLKALHQAYANAKQPLAEPPLAQDGQVRPRADTADKQPYVYTPPEQSTAHPDFQDWDADPHLRLPA